MPILNIQTNFQIPDHSGKLAPGPPALGLTQKGPLLPVLMSLSQSIATQLLQQGQSVQAPISGIGIIDTGASCTCIDDTIAQNLQLPVINIANIHSASHSAVQQNVYPVHIEVVGFGLHVEAQAVGAQLQTQGLAMLIGRDVLQHCTLIYNGPMGLITLAI